jgi:hypothetical protein
MPKKKRKSTGYNLNKLWDDCLACYQLSDPEMREAMIEQIWLKMKGYKLEHLRKWDWNEIIKAIMDWCDDKLKENKELYKPYVAFMLQTLNLTK